MSRRKYLFSRDERRIEATPIDRLKLLGEVWGAALVTAGTAAYGANQQRDAARDAQAGVDAASAIQQQQYEQTRQDQMPWLQAGQRNLNTLMNLNEGDYSSFTESPDYQFARDQGIKGLDRSAASRGTQYSGGQLAAHADFSGGLARQNYGQYYNRIASLAGVGQTAAQNLGQAGQGYANNASNLAMERGNIGADARLATASTYGQAAGQIGNAFGRWYQGQNASVDPISRDQWNDAYAQIPPTDPNAWRSRF